MRKFSMWYWNFNLSCQVIFPVLNFPVGIYMFQVKNRNTRTRYETRSRLTIKTPKQRLALLSSIEMLRSLITRIFSKSSKCTSPSSRLKDSRCENLLFLVELCECFISHFAFVDKGNESCYVGVILNMATT